MAKDENQDLRRRLLQEATTPWRTVRQFFFGAFGFSAGIGGLTALSQLAASVAGRQDALPFTQSVTNVAVDLGVVVACVIGWQLDARAATDVTQEPLALTDSETEARTAQLLKLRVSVGIDDRRIASLETLRSVAKQCIVVLAGPERAVDDAIRDAFIQQKLFVDAECLVVPVRLDSDTGNLVVYDDDDERNMYQAGFIAKPDVDDSLAWADFVRNEIATAKEQGEQLASSIGVVIALRQDASIARRGVGKPPWKPLLSDLQLSSSSSSDDDNGDRQKSNGDRQKSTSSASSKGFSKG